MVHEFKPITAQPKLQAAIVYVCRQGGLLARKVLDEQLTIDIACLFTHSQDEFTFVHDKILTLGPLSKYTKGPTTYVECNLDIEGRHIVSLGVREPDATRPEVGYVDYPVSDFGSFVESQRDNPYIAFSKSALGDTLVELRHPDFDVRGYAYDVTR